MWSILITGSNRGIGLGLVKMLLSGRNTPDHIIATCRKPAEAKDLQELARANSNIHILQHDVTNFANYEKLREEVTKIVGPEGLNVLINNAGIYGKSLKIGYLKPDSMIETYTVNTVAPVILTKELLPLLRLAADKNKDKPLGPQRAAVVNITSSLGSIADNSTGGYYPYRCSKSALNCATKSLSVDLRPYNIIATCLHPGWVKTDMGGPKAPLGVDESTKAMINTINNLNETHNGCFLSYDGSGLPW